MNPFKALLDHSEIALCSTAPIYRFDDRDRLELFGSGLLIRHGGRHFVLSAAHVLVELRTKKLGIGGETSIVPLTGPFFHTGKVGQVDFGTDSFDAAFVPLREEQVSGLTGTLFLSENSIEWTAPRSMNARYYAVGFIASDFRPTGSNQSVEAKEPRSWLCRHLCPRTNNVGLRKIRTCCCHLIDCELIRPTGRPRHQRLVG